MATHPAAEHHSKAAEHHKEAAKHHEQATEHYENDMLLLSVAHRTLAGLKRGAGNPTASGADQGVGLGNLLVPGRLDDPPELRCLTAAEPAGIREFEVIRRGHQVLLGVLIRLARAVQVWHQPGHVLAAWRDMKGWNRVTDRPASGRSGGGRG